MRAVITFHAIDGHPGPLSFPPANLRTLLGALRDASVPIVPLDQLLRPEAPEGVSLTFDDGLTSVYDNAWTILKEFGAVGHVFVTTGSIGADNHWPSQPASAQRYKVMNWRQLERLASGGLLIECHTARHEDLRTLADAEIEREMAAADDLIAEHLGRRPQFFAYPYGYHDARVRGLAAARYRAAFTTDLRFLPDIIDPAAVPRLDSHYLRSGYLVRHLGSHAARSYLQCRRLLRCVRQWV